MANLHEMGEKEPTIETRSPTSTDVGFLFVKVSQE
jgi:hypothetical protein